MHSTHIMRTANIKHRASFKLQETIYNSKIRDAGVRTSHIHNFMAEVRDELGSFRQVNQSLSCNATLPLARLAYNMLEKGHLHPGCPCAGGDYSSGSRTQRLEIGPPRRQETKVSLELFCGSLVLTSCPMNLAN